MLLLIGYITTLTIFLHLGLDTTEHTHLGLCK